MRIEYHRKLLADQVRNAALFRALQAVIIAGETSVADIGAGTGLLGLMAMQLGAKQVFLYESEAIGGVAEQILRQNKARNCVLMACHSLDMVDPPRVDIVVTETLGNYPLEEDLLATARDAKRRHLKPGGVLIPRHIDQFVAPVTVARLHHELTSWDRVGYGLNFDAARTMGLNNIYVRRLTADDLLDQGTGAVRWDGFDLLQDPAAARKGEARFALTADTTIFGFAIWWTAGLVNGVILSTAPNAPPTHWEQLYLPLLTPIEGKPGQQVTIAIRSRTTRSTGTTLAWVATHNDAGGRRLARQALDLERGYLP